MEDVVQAAAESWMIMMKFRDKRIVALHTKMVLCHNLLKLLNLLDFYHIPHSASSYVRFCCESKESVTKLSGDE